MFVLIVHQLDFLRKLEGMEITDDLPLWFASFVSKRIQNVAIENSKILKSMFLPGCHLQPLLFLFYFNDICSYFRFYLDDMKILRTIRMSLYLVFLQEDMDKITAWWIHFAKSSKMLPYHFHEKQEH